MLLRKGEVKAAQCLAQLEQDRFVHIPPLTEQMSIKAALNIKGARSGLEACICLALMSNAHSSEHVPRVHTLIYT